MAVSASNERLSPVTSEYRRASPPSTAPSTASMRAERLISSQTPAAAAALAARIGGVWENDVERSEQTRVAEGELRKLALAAGGVAEEDAHGGSRVEPNKGW